MAGERMKIGSYEVQGTIGRGGFGTVVRAKSPSGEVVAIKVLMSKHPDQARRFEREVQILSKLGAKDGFVPLLGSGSSELGPYLVMPFVAGGSLAERLQKGPLGLDPAISLCSRLAKAMGRAHRKGIVHRDLKPDNILFTAGGDPLIADLGLAKHFREDVRPGSGGPPRVSETGEVRGTYGYMAPEQIRDAKSVGPGADVFALGAILYECISGKPAFPGTSLVEVLGQVALCELEALKRSDIPPWVVALIRAACQFDARDRPRDATEYARLLTAAGRALWKRRAAAAVVGAALGIGLALKADELTLWLRTLTEREAPPAAIDGEGSSGR